MDRLKLITAVSVAVLLVACVFAALSLLQDSEEVPYPYKVVFVLPEKLQRPLTQERLEEAREIFEKYGQVMTDVFNQHGYEVYLEWEDIGAFSISYTANRAYIAYIDRCLESPIYVELFLDSNSERVTIGQSVPEKSVLDIEYRYQGFNIDLLSDLLCALSGGQIPHGEIPSFLSCDYELLSWYEIERGWWPGIRGPPMIGEKLKLEQLYGMYYGLVDNGRYFGEMLHVEIFHLGGL